MEREYMYIGKLNKKLLNIYNLKVISEDVILTNERKSHIKSRHPEIYNDVMGNIRDILYQPDYILEDRKNEDTVLLVKKLELSISSYIVVVKLNTNEEQTQKHNSILTFWKIRDRNLKKQLETQRVIYKKIL